MPRPSESTSAPTTEATLPYLAPDRLVQLRNALATVIDCGKYGHRPPHLELFRAGELLHLLDERLGELVPA